MALPFALQQAQANLQQQVASGGINQAQADAELQRLQGLLATNTELQQAQANLQQQVSSGGINQAQADNEFNRLFQLVASGQSIAPPQQQKPAGPVQPPLSTSTNFGPHGATPPKQNPAQVGNVLDVLAGGDPAISGALRSGQAIGDMFFSEGSLGRLDPSIIQDEALALNRARELMQQNPRLDEQQRAINRLESMSGALGFDPQQQIGRIDGVDAQFGNFTDAETSALNMLQERAMQGLSPEERTAYLEQGRSGINKALATANAGAAQQNLARGAQGGIANIPFFDTAMAALSAENELQRNLRLEDVAARDRRVSEFANLAPQMTTNVANRATAGAMNSLNARLGVTGQQFNQMLGANTAFAQGAMNQRNSDVSNAINTLASFYNSTLNPILSRQVGSQVFNLNNLANELSGRIGSIFTAGSFGAAQQGQRNAYDLGLRQIDAARGANVSGPTLSFGGSSGNSSSSDGFLNF